MKPSWSALTFLLAAEAAGCAHAPPVAGRYLYEVMCAANVARFDTVEQMKTGEYDLAQQPGAAGLIPASEGVLEDCLVADTVFEPNASVFHALVRTSWQLTELLSYRLLTFSVPELALVKQEPAGAELGFQPELEVVEGRVRVAAPGKPRLRHLDLAGFAPGHEAVPNRVSWNRRMRGFCCGSWGKQTALSPSPIVRKSPSFTSSACPPRIRITFT